LTRSPAWRYRRAVDTKPDRKLEAIGALTFTTPLALALAAVAHVSLYAGWAAITVVVTAALLVRVS
jgi:hypothetical protein